MMCGASSWFRISDEELVKEFKKLLEDLEVSKKDIEIIIKLFNDFARSGIDKKFELALEIYKNRNFIKIVMELLTEDYIPSKTFSQVSYELANALTETQQKFSKIQDISRDNVIHQIQVFLVGCYFLYNNKDFWLEYLRSEIVEYVKDNVGEKATKQKGGKNKLIRRIKKQDDYVIEFKHIFSIWAICSLYHDMGKTFEDLYKYSKESGKILDTIGSVLNISVDFKSRNIFDEIKLFKPLISSRRKFFKLLYKELLYKQRNPEKYNILKKILEYDFKHLKHGFYSALLVTLMLLKDKGSAVVLLRLLLPSLIAMSLHVYKDAYIFGSLTQLLIIADNIQEWQRSTKFYDRRFIMFTDKVMVSREIKKGRDGIEYLVYHVIIKHELDKNNIWMQTEGKYEKITTEDGKNAIETLFKMSTKPEERYKEWGEDFTTLLKSLWNLNDKEEIDKKKKELFELFLKETIKNSKKAVGLTIELNFGEKSKKVLYICGRCHRSKHYTTSEVEFKCECSN